MSTSRKHAKRVGQSAYWMYFIANFVLAPALLVGALVAVIYGSFGIAIFCILLLLPLTVNFRVIMMRRCRDIGWPVFLPWVSFGCSMVLGMINAGAVVGNPQDAFGAVMASSGLSIVISLIDFVFMIVIGCIASKAPDIDYVKIFGDDDRQPQAPLPRVATARDDDGGDQSRWDAAIAARLAALSDPGAPAAVSAIPVAAPEPRFAVRPAVAGFGRKVA
ncbi:MAG: hypothetical protein ACKVOJ_11320 [Sphingomonadaceae bacterium]